MKTIFDTAKLHLFLQPFFLLVGFLWNSFLTKNLSVSDYGLFSISITLFSILSIFSNLGMSGGLMKYIPFYEEKKKFNNLKNVYYFSLIIPLLMGCIFYLVVCTFHRYIQNYFIENFSSVVNILGLYIVLNAFISSLMKIVITKGDFLYAKLNELTFQKLLPLIILYILTIFLKLDIFIVSSIYILGYILSIYFISKRVFIYYKEISLENFKKFFDKDFFKYSFYINLSGLVSMLYMWSDNLMIGYFLDNYSVGIYSAVFLVAVIVKNFWYMAFSPILVPVLSKYIANRDFVNVKNTFEILQKSLFVLTIPMFLVLLYFGDNIIEILFTTKYLEGHSSLLVLGILYLSSIFFGYSSYVISSYGNSKILFKVTVITLVFNIVLNIILIPKLNILGAAISTGISELLYAIFTYIIVYKRYNLSIRSKVSYVLLFGLYFIFALHILQNSFEYVFISLFLIIYLFYSFIVLKKMYVLYKEKI